MKKALLYCSILVTLIVVGFYSCKPDSNNDPQPSVDPRDKFIGTWTCHETSHIHGTSAYPVTISYDPSNTSYVLLANFYMLSDTIKIQGLVTNSTITISNQTTSCNCTFNGSGTLTNSTTMNWNYTATDIADIDTCTATYNK